MNKQKNIRNTMRYEWQRLAFDALALPADDLRLTGEEKDAFLMKAREAVGWIDWENYTAVRESFLYEAEMLLKSCPASASAGDDLRRRMYVRFMEGRIRWFEHLEREEACPVPAVPVGERDFHNTELATVFAHLPEQPYIAGRLGELDVSWNYDQLHMVTWFSGQLSLGSGEYSRSRPNHSAKVTYERLLNPFSLLWVAAALGEDMDLVARTRREMDDYASWRVKCCIVRRNIPWDRIYELALPWVEQKKGA